MSGFALYVCTCETIKRAGGGYRCPVHGPHDSPDRQTAEVATSTEACVKTSPTNDAADSGPPSSASRGSR